MTVAGTPAAIAQCNNVTVVAARAVVNARSSHPFYGPRIRLMATADRASRVATYTTGSVFPLWTAADRINAGGRDLIREIEGR